jgi:hypothetical protein
LAKGFEEDDASCDRNVEGFYRASCRKRDDKVAALACQLVEAFAFTA